MSSRTRAVVAVRAFAAFFLVVGVAVLVVGVHDASIAAGSLGVLLASIVLVLVGALFVIAAWRLATMTGRSVWPGDARPPCKEPVPMGLLVAVILGGYVFFGALGAAGLQRWILITVSVVFIAVGFAGMRFFWRDVDTSVVRVGASIALAVAGIAIGLGEFWYQSQYVPSHLGRAVSLQAEMKIVGEQKDDYVVSVALGYQDIGGRSVAVIGSTYTLTGSRLIRCDARRHRRGCGPCSEASSPTHNAAASWPIPGRSSRRRCSRRASSSATGNASTRTSRGSATDLLRATPPLSAASIPRANLRHLGIGTALPACPSGVRALPLRQLPVRLLARRRGQLAA